MTKKKKWNILDKTQSNPIDQILVNRGIPLGLKNDFTHPQYSKLHDPYLLKDMKRAVERVFLAAKLGDKIGIFADYDADGVTSAALMREILVKVGLEPIVYIPSRDEGYGLNRIGIDKFNLEGVKLLIAVDMGITGKNEVDYCHSLSIDTIIIDHHLVQMDKIPTGLVINPRQDSDEYPFKDLSACGLVYKFGQAISLEHNDIISQTQLKWWLDLVAISTIADMVPLVDENRIIAHFGLIVLGKTKRVGLRALFEISNISRNEINTSTVGFKIAPRLNAPGRIEHANSVYTLLISSELNEAKVIAYEIEAQNNFRREETERIFNEAKVKILKLKLSKNKVIVVSGKNWSPGLVGIVAGRIMEEFARPTIILDENKNMLKGSARSIQGYHLLDAFEFNSKLLKTFGGHARAGGLSMSKANLDKFYQGILKFADTCLSDNDLALGINIDYELEDKDMDLSLAKDVAKLEPFGFGNQRPLFILRSQYVSSLKRVGKDLNHLKLKLGNNSAIFFNAINDNEDSMLEGQSVDVIFNLSINSWNNRTNLDMNIIDWKVS